MAWVLTKNLQAFRTQVNAAFPNRDKTSDGTIGDIAHQSNTSGHNPDDTAGVNAEWDNDADTIAEVRAIDIDKDLNSIDGVIMEDVVQHLLKMARAGQLSVIRYIIYNRRIWKSTNNWRQETYTGVNPHERHMHLSGAYSQTADEAGNFDYRLDELIMPTVQEIADAVWNYGLIDPRNTAAKKSAGAWLRYSEITANNAIANFFWGAYHAAKGDEAYVAADEATQKSWRNYRDTLQQGVAIDSVINALVSIGAKVDLDPEELEAIKEALNVPTAEENALAFLNAIGGITVDKIIEGLKATLTEDQLARLKANL